MREGTVSIGKYCVKAALERRGGDGEDLLSVLGNAHIKGRSLTDRELAHNGVLYVERGSKPRATLSQPDCWR